MSQLKLMSVQFLQPQPHIRVTVLQTSLHYTFQSMCPARIGSLGKAVSIFANIASYLCTLYTVYRVRREERGQVVSAYKNVNNNGWGYKNYRHTSELASHLSFAIVTALSFFLHLVMSSMNI